MYVATSESGLTCVCDKSWAGGRRGQGSRAASYKVRPPLFTATFLQFYNKSSPSVRADNCAPVCGAGQLLGPRIRQHLGPLTALTTCRSAYSPVPTLPFRVFSVTASPIFVRGRGCARSNKATHHFPSALCPISLLTADPGPHASRGGRCFVLGSPKDMIGENISPRM